MKKLLSLLLIICSIGVAYADDKSTVTSLKYVTDELNTRQDKFGANDGKAMTFTNVAGGNAPRDVKTNLGSNTSDNGLPTVSAVNTGIATKQDEIGAANTNTVVTYTGVAGTVGQKGIYQDTGTYASQQDNLIDAGTFNAALRNGLENEFVCADRDPVSNQCWLWTIDNATENQSPNLFAPPVAHKGYSSNGVRMENNNNFVGNWEKIDVTPGETYTVSWENIPETVTAVLVARWDNNGDFISRIEMPKNSDGYFATYTVPQGAKQINFALYRSGGLTISDDTHIQIERGSTATPYVPYNMNIYIPQNQSAQNQ